jgi:glycosyltransferase involved in cell wall biosynthesis
MISVLILTLNEEANIAQCLDSVAWADDVFVLDSGSEDRTVEIAEERGARVLHRPFDNFANQRNYGLREGNLAHDWVLHLDADERVPPALRDELRRKTRTGSQSAYRLPSKLMFRGTWLKYSGMYPTYQVRFGEREALTFEQVGHGQRSELSADHVGTIDEPLVHHAFSKGIADWVERHNRYSTDEVERALEVRQETVDWRGLVSGEAQRRRRALKDLSYRLPFRPLLRFLYMYVGRLGVLDGRPGFTYCMLLAIYEYMTMLKVDEREREGDSR